MVEKVQINQWTLVTVIPKNPNPILKSCSPLQTWGLWWVQVIHHTLKNWTFFFFHQIRHYVLILKGRQITFHSHVCSLFMPYLIWRVSKIKNLKIDTEVIKDHIFKFERNRKYFSFHFWFKKIYSFRICAYFNDFALV